MAQHLLDRIAASLRPTGRIADARHTLAEAERELRTIDGRIAEAEHHSTDPTASDEDARRASERAADFRLLKRRLERGVDELREAIAAKEEARRSEERVSAYQAAKAPNDALTEEWQRFGAEVYPRFIDLLARTHAQNQANAHVNRALPEGAPRLLSPELMARGPMNSDRWANGEPYRSLLDIEWDNFSKSGFAWSLADLERRTIAAASHRDAQQVAAAVAAEAARNTPEAVAARRRAEAARFASYEVTDPRYPGSGRKPVRHRDGTAGIGAESAFLFMDEAQVEAARQRGLKVEESIKEPAGPFEGLKW